MSALLERAEELDAVAALARDAARGTGRLLVVEGEAGLGKSALLAAARERGAADGLRVLNATGSELETEFSFGIALQLFAGAVADPQRRAALLTGAAALAAPVFEPGGRDEHPEFAIFHGLHWLTAGLAEEQPLLLSVDDAHWADALSLRFLHYLAQRLDELPVALTLALRPSDADVVRRLARHRLARVVTLAPLSAGAVAEIVRDRLHADATDQFCEACAHTTGGNPFYLRELLAAQPPAGALPAESASVVVRNRLAALAPGALRLAESVAVLGPGTPLRRAAAHADADPDAAATAADELARAGILTPGPALAFTHPILGEAVYNELPPARRAREHARAARLLAADGIDPERVAAQLVAAGGADDEWSVGAFLQAARSARARGATPVAARHLSAAVAGPVPADERPALLLEAALAHAHSRTPDAPARVAAALDAIAGGGYARAQAALELGLALADGGAHRDAAKVFDRGLSDVDHADDELAMTLRASRAAIGGLDAAHELPGGLEAIFARTARGVATTPERLMLAHGALAAGLSSGGTAAEVATLARGAVDGAEFNMVTALDMSALALAAIALIVAGELREAEGVLTAAIERTREEGSVTAFATASHARAFAYLRQGRLDDAIADAQSVLDAARYGWEPALPAAHAVLALASVERGEPAAATAALELPGGERRWGESFTWNDYLEARAHLRLAEGDAHGALADALECGRRLTAMGATHPSVVAWRATAARAAAALGDAEQAASLADADVADARRFGASWGLGVALRTAGTLAGGDSGIELLREAIVVLAPSDARLELAHAQQQLGDELLAGGHRLAARDPLREALDIAVRSGAAPLAERARAGLVATGARPRRAASTGRDALTPRELRIAGMAAGGASNREIAEALFITMKTVETHLGHVYAKLGVTSRNDLPRALTS